jgi:5-formyltetrahydrofolate cyclo-ligase
MTQTLFQKALESGLHVYFPRVEQGIKFYEVNGPEDLEKGSWSIPEPKIHCRELVADAKFDLLVVPGIVFNKDCFRIGYGRGFYDKFFSSLAVEVPTVSLAYDFQVVDFFEQDVWDKPVKAVITEKKTCLKD